MDPVIQELCRARDLQPHALRRMQQYFSTVIQSKLDERERLIEENARLREALAQKTAKRSAA